MLYAVQSFALLPLLRQRLQVRLLFCFHTPTDRPTEISIPFTDAHMLRDRVLVRRSTYSYPHPSPRDASKLFNLWLSSRPSMGPEIQKVRSSSSRFEHI